MSHKVLQFSTAAIATAIAASATTSAPAKIRGSMTLCLTLCFLLLPWPLLALSATVDTLASGVAASSPAPASLPASSFSTASS